MRMTRLTTRNVLLVIGVWAASNLVAMLFRFLFFPISTRPIFTGEAGIVAAWLWEVPEALVAAVAAVALVRVIETKRPLVWVGILASLFLYGGSVNAWKWIRLRGVTSPSPVNKLGILTQTIVPTLACFIAGTWWTRRSAAPKVVVT